MTRDDAITKILEHYKEYDDDFTHDIEELDAYNGYLGDDRCISMDDFNELMSGKEPWELARMIYFGTFNPNDDYFYFNAYGNLESTNYPDYSSFFGEYFAEDLIECYDKLDYITPEVSEIIESIDDENE